MPGPVLTVTVSESIKRGSHAGPLLILGHGILELILVLAILAGLAPFFTREDVFVGISMAGGLILLYMSYTMLRDLPKLKLSLTGEKDTSRNLITSGIMLSLANPYWFIWWATIGIGYIVYAMKFGTIGVVFFFSGHILADLAWYSFISLAASKGRRFLSDRLYRCLIGFCAFFLVVFAGYFFYSGTIKLLSITM